MINNMFAIVKQRWSLVIYDHVSATLVA